MTNYQKALMVACLMHGAALIVSLFFLWVPAAYR